jgi:predicted deacylase
MTPGTKPAASTPQDPLLTIGLPEFPVHIDAPDISHFLDGNTGIPGFTTRNSGRPGLHVVLVALTHGNEIAGATVLAELLRENFTPICGRLTLGFANIAAFDRFDAANPLASRFVEEDLNRVWDDVQLFGVRRSIELDRAREIRPLIDTADILLDLHSMLWPADPLMLCGPTSQGRDLALQLATPALVVADQGHAGGKRLIDYGRFTEATGTAAGILVEAGQHWEDATIGQTRATISALLHHAGMVAHPPPGTLAPPRFAPPRFAPPRFAQVTYTVTARTHRFVFTQNFRGGDVVPAANTLIAHDGNVEIRTPHENCLLIMPSLKSSRGHTAVRLARWAALPGLEGPQR